MNAGFPAVCLSSWPSIFTLALSEKYSIIWLIERVQLFFVKIVSPELNLLSLFYCSSIGSYPIHSNIHSSILVKHTKSFIVCAILAYIPNLCEVKTNKQMCIAFMFHYTWYKFKSLENKLQASLYLVCWKRMLTVLLWFFILMLSHDILLTMPQRKWVSDMYLEKQWFNY